MTLFIVSLLGSGEKTQDQPVYDEVADSATQSTSTQRLTPTYDDDAEITAVDVKVNVVYQKPYSLERKKLQPSTSSRVNTDITVGQMILNEAYQPMLQKHRPEPNDYHQSVVELKPNVAYDVILT